MAHILLIDDDDAVRQVMRLTLERMGHRVSDAATGREGLGLFEREGADVVITDIVMPEKEGLEVIFELSRKHGLRSIIAMSGGGRMMRPEDYLKIAGRMGALRMLTKPFSNEELETAVNEVLASSAKK